MDAIFESLCSERSTTVKCSLHFLPCFGPLRLHLSLTTVVRNLQRADNFGIPQPAPSGGTLAYSISIKIRLSLKSLTNLDCASKESPDYRATHHLDEKPLSNPHRVIIFLFLLNPCQCIDLPY